ncbi:ryanodine receptor 2-like [Oreochromis niloticus]|uniref:ryanodine receptor 2-like n=1 Tax=Oreochromis niloticus TaxID=8128 RepID=UPI000905C5E6|nr:ryanodine receptor 2-like [Oreochromis niloticus]
MALYRDLPNHYEDTTDPEKTVERILDIGHVLFHLEQVEHPQRSKKAVWHKLLSKQRREMSSLASGWHHSITCQGTGL